MLAPLEDTLAEGEVIIDEEDPEDTAPMRTMTSPKQPTEDEVEQHRIDHQPFRSWCKWCVMGRGLGQPHTGSSRQSSIPIVGIDYFFITSEGLQRRSELGIPDDDEGDEKLSADRNEGKVVKCLIVRCFHSKCLYAHMVPQKGDDEEHYCAKLVVADVEWLGHTNCIIKSDNERAIVALRRRVTRVLRASEHMVGVQEESPVAYDSQSNGAIEVGVRILRGMYRTFKLCLESRIGKYVPATHPMSAWLLQHVCTVLNSRTRGPDGQTPWERIKGRPFRQLLLGFGECVLHKLPGKGPESQPDGNMGSKWQEGVFLGYSRSSNAYVVATADGVRNTRALYRRPAANRWNHQKISDISSTPWSMREKTDELPKFVDKDEVDEAPARAPAAMPRAFKINYKDLVEHGFTRGCPQCEHAEKFQRSKGGMSHSAACRHRLLEAFMQTPSGRKRLEAYEERVDHAIADRIADHDAQPAAEQRDQDQPRSHDHDDGAEPRSAPRGPPVYIDYSDQMPVPAQLIPDGVQRQGNTDHEPNDATPLPDSLGDDTDMGYLGNVNDTIATLVLQSLGHVDNRRQFNDLKNGVKNLVSEIYSPPRITLELQRSRFRNLAPGLALDLTVVDPDDGLPWDFADPAKRAKARRMLRKNRPVLLIGSPMCTAFSTWQRLNRTKTGRPDEMQREYVRACLHMRFVFELYQEQMDAGQYFLHEHPRYASSWDLDFVQDLLARPGVEMAHADQCQYGAVAPSGKDKGSPVRKPTGFMSNSPEILRALSRRCTGRQGECSRAQGGDHTPCQGSITKAMAKYPRELCRAVLRGLSNQLRSDKKLKPGCFGLQAVDDEEEPKEYAYGPAQGYSGKYKDDLTGQVLKDELVEKARAAELAFFTSKEVWKKVPRARAHQRTGQRPISVRWVDVNKGDEVEPNYRSRLVARQLKALDKSGTCYFAPAPPLEALRTVISMTVTRCGAHQPIWDPESAQRAQLSFIDVKRAYFNAKVDRDAAPVFVELPAEEPGHGELCGELIRHMYGTRPAADGWQEEYSTAMVRMGFAQGMASPNVFHHESRGIKCSVHGDDFTSSGPADALDWFEEQLGAEYELSIGPRLGPGKNDAKQARALNRVITWYDDRIEYEADPRQAERLVNECGLEGAKTVATPGVKASFADHEADSPLDKRLHTPFRGSAARGNYLAADRIDTQFACKEVCRWMATPTQQSWKALKRLCRYLCGKPRMTYVYRRQDLNAIDVYCDTDWAGCTRTRKSTSGGVVMLGRHTIKHWSSTQPSVTLSSGEAEFYGVVRGSGQGLGYQSLLKDLGLSIPLRIWTDSSAAIGVCSRQGLGKLRHLDTHTLWVQQAVRSKRLVIKKVLGEENPADLLTKHSISQERVNKLAELFDCKFADGRAESAPKLRNAETSKATIGKADELNGLRAQEEQERCAGQKGLYGDFQPVQGDHLPGSDIQPRMPHLEYSAEELERHYPSLEPPDDLELDDLSRLEDDLLYNAGMPVVQQILDEMAVNGRTRKAHSERVVSSVESSHTVLPSTFSKQPRQDCHPSSRRSVRFDGVNRTVDGFTSRPFCGLAQGIFRE